MIVLNISDIIRLRFSIVEFKTRFFNLSLNSTKQI